MSSLQTYSLLALIPSLVLGSFFWYRAKVLLKAKGFPVSFFSHRRHMQDFFYMKEMIHSERSWKIRASHEKLRTCMKAFFIANILLSLTFLLATLIPILQEN